MKMKTLSSEEEEEEEETPYNEEDDEKAQTIETKVGAVRGTGF
jgi:hypothetical protein